jgi:molecular chaperone DnaK
MSVELYEEPEITGGPIIGIDLGTSTSAIAYWDDLSGPMLVADKNGDRLIPSIVQLGTEGELIVGSVAKKNAITFPERTTLEIKRLMGTGETVKLGSKMFFPEEISAAILRHLKQIAEEHLGEPVRDVVLSVPARFANAAREATKKAAVMAGLNVIRLINEPTAAALAYGIDHQTQIQKLLVFDLGGGTLDITILEIFEGILDVKTSVGDEKLGSKDIDDAIIDIFRAEYEKQHKKKIAFGAKSRRNSQILKAGAEFYKEQLTDVEEIEVDIPNLGDGLKFTFTRDFLYEKIEELLMRAMGLVNEALSRSRLTWEDIDIVLPVGGSSHIPLFRRALEFASGKPMSDVVAPEEAVVLGTAIAAHIERTQQEEFAQQSNLIVLDVSPHRLGVATIKQTGPGQYVEDFFSELIPKDAKLPAIYQREYQTLQKDGSPLRIQIYEASGESCLCRDHHQISIMELRSLSGDTVNEPVQVEFRYTLDGTLDVTARYSSAPIVAVQGSYALDNSQTLDINNLAELQILGTKMLDWAELYVQENVDEASDVQELANHLRTALARSQVGVIRETIDMLTDLQFARAA